MTAHAVRVFTVTELKPLSAVASEVVFRAPRSRRRATRFLVVLVVVVLFGNAIIGERGLVALFRANGELQAVSALIETLRAVNDGLRDEVRELTEEPRRIEEIARKELGLIRPGERVLIIRKVPAQIARSFGASAR